MASTYSNLKIELIGTGEQSGTWGTTTNTNLGTAIEQAIAGYGTANFTSDADLTLGYTDSNASQTFRNLVLNLTSSGSLTATRNLIVPTTAKLYYVFNNTTGSQSIVVKTSAGTGITIPNASKAVVFCDGTNVVEVVNRFGSLTLGAALPIASGGTGATSLSGANIAVTNAANTFSALQTFSGSSSVAATKLANAKEVATISATAATGTINYDVTTQSVLYYTSNASANWTTNFRGSSGTSLDTLMATGESITATFLVTQGSTAYYNSAVQVDGNAVTPKWQGGTAPTAGNASSIDAYTYTIIKTGSATFTVLAAQTKFA